MQISVKVITNSSRNAIEEVGNNEFKAYLTCVPEKGKANKQLIKLLSKHFSVSKSSIEIKVGELSKNKILEIEK
ncbi:MAG: DUF167 domain-containing protein [Alphaproteobacteria bacterium]|jgi:uncharacterized protein (TIGR00251 family)|nr:DUF167 domain-containing protein [Alphaproteobacteria bacterium]